MCGCSDGSTCAGSSCAAAASASIQHAYSCNLLGSVQTSGSFTVANSKHIQLKRSPTHSIAFSAAALNMRLHTPHQSQMPKDVWSSAKCTPWTGATTWPPLLYRRGSQLHPALPQGRVVSLTQCLGIACCPMRSRWLFPTRCCQHHDTSESRMMIVGTDMPLHQPLNLCWCHFTFVGVSPVGESGLPNDFTSVIESHLLDIFAKIVKRAAARLVGVS